MAANKDQWREIFQGVNPALSQDMTEDHQDKKDMQGADESDETSPRDYIKRFEVAAHIATSQPP